MVKDVEYWRNRALRAEEALEQIKLTTHDKLALIIATKALE